MPTGIDYLKLNDTVWQFADLGVTNVEWFVYLYFFQRETAEWPAVHHGTAGGTPPLPLPFAVDWEVLWSWSPKQSSAIESIETSSPWFVFGPRNEFGVASVISGRTRPQVGKNGRHWTPVPAHLSSSRCLYGGDTQTVRGERNIKKKINDAKLNG